MMKKRKHNTIDLTGDDVPIDLTCDDNLIVDLTKDGGGGDDEAAAYPAVAEAVASRPVRAEPDNVTPGLRAYAKNATREWRRSRQVLPDELRRRRELEDLQFENKFIAKQPQHDHTRGRRLGNAKDGRAARVQPDAAYDPLQVAHELRAESTRFPFEDGYGAWHAQKTWITPSEASTANAEATRLMKKHTLFFKTNNE